MNREEGIGGEEADGNAQKNFLELEVVDNDIFGQNIYDYDMRKTNKINEIREK